MHENDYGDLRNTGAGHFSWTEHELFSVFVPLIGIHGLGVYMAMCRLIPRAAADPDFKVTSRAVAETCGAKNTMTNRMIGELVALGMVLETKHGKRRASSYKIAILRDLAKLGTKELEHRLGVHRADTARRLAEAKGVVKRVDAAAEKAPAARATHAESRSGAAKRASSPGGRGGGLVRVADTDAVTGKTVDKLTFVDMAVSARRGSVSATEPSVSAQSELVSAQSGHALIKEVEVEVEEVNTPLPPEGDEAFSRKAEATGKSQSKDERLPDEGQDKSEAAAVADAVAKVMRECNLPMRRIAPVIEAAMRLEGAKTDEPADWNAIAERMSASYEHYLSHAHLMKWTSGARKFFAEGMWRDQRKWPWDEKLVHASRRL